MIARMTTFTAQCLLPSCPWAERWSNERAAQGAAVWHVYDDHPQTFLAIIGRPPVEARPWMLGQRVSV